MLELTGAAATEALLALWRARIERAAAALGWSRSCVAVRHHAGGAELALSAPRDQLFTATEVNEWALCAALRESDPQQWRGLEESLALVAAESAASARSTGITGPGVPPVLDEARALARLEQLAAAERRPGLEQLLQAAQQRSLQFVLDDTTLTLGAGVGSRDFALDELPAPADVPWPALGNIPAALVTGSNGKTTTVRLLAACARAHGLSTALCSTEGVFQDDATLALGDYSGPEGARRAIRCRSAQAVVLETARGGILRRGLALERAAVAVITNISCDHFGEYGIEDLEGLADVKLTVAAALPADGLLVLNADDALLRQKVATLAQRFGRVPRLGWFALDADHELLREHRARGGLTCGVRDGRLCLALGAAEHDLGAVAALPLTVEGSALYNVANLAGAALGAAGLAVPPDVIARVFARFGQAPDDNPGRMMRYEIGGVRVLVDYAHNPDGLRGLLTVARHLRGNRGRIGVLLGHAGNRRDEEIEQVAQVVAGFRPDLVVIKENEAHLRGREPGEVPRILHAALLRAGQPESGLALRMTEVEAARHALEWARPGDVLALPLHAPQARAAVLALLAAGRASD